MRPARSLVAGTALLTTISASLCGCVQDWAVGPEDAGATQEAGDAGDPVCDTLKAAVSDKLLAAQTCSISVSVCYTDIVVDECGCPVPVANVSSFDVKNTDYVRAVSDLKSEGCALECPDACPVADDISAWCTSTGSKSICQII